MAQFFDTNKALTDFDYFLKVVPIGGETNRSLAWAKDVFNNKTKAKAQLKSEEESLTRTLRKLQQSSESITLPFKPEERVASNENWAQRKKVYDENLAQFEKTLSRIGDGKKVDEFIENPYISAGFTADGTAVAPQYQGGTKTFASPDEEAAYAKRASEGFSQYIPEENLTSATFSQIKPQNVSGNADEAFINQVAQMKFGRNATKDELATLGSNAYGLLGATKKDVLGRFGISEDQFLSGGTPSNTGTNTIATIPQEDKTWVNNLYQKYFDRAATSAELSNWGSETPNDLEKFLQNEAKSYNYTSQYFKDQKKSGMNDAFAIIDSAGLDPVTADAWKQFVSAYDSDTVDVEEMLSTFKKIKSETLDPYWKAQVANFERGFQDNIDSLEQARQLELESQRYNAGQNIKQAKEGLEAAGMTFTGKAIEQLGANSAYAQEGESQMPTQTPFGGLFYEGSVPMANRISATSSQARYEEARKALGRSIEEQLGSNAVTKFGLGYVPTGGIEGSVTEAQKQKEAQTLQQLIDQREAKQELNTIKPTI